MPIYEYECKSCGQRFELRRRVADKDGEVTCPKCGDEQPRRLFSIFATVSSSETCAPNNST